VNRLKSHGKETLANDVESLSHTKWECKYHIVFIPKYRRKALYGALRQQLGEVLKQLAMQRESRIDEGHLMRDHVHMLVSIPPKYSVSQVVGYVKGKSAIHIARRFMGKPRNFTGESFWARGTLSRPWDEMKSRSASTYRSKSRKTNESIN
jgi:putative transposase